jgi:hypothetical protein
MVKPYLVFVCAPLMLCCATAPATPRALAPADEAAAFTAAGYTRKGAEWHNCDEPPSPSYSPGEITEVRDLDGDGRPEAVLVEGGAA